MFSFFARIFQWISDRAGPWAWVLKAGILVAVIGLSFTAVNSIQSCGYSKGSARYHEEEQKWKTERAALLARAEEKERRVAELEPKAIAFDALAEQHKAIDRELAKKVEEVSSNAASEEAKADQPTDCRTRAQRVCDLLRANNIRHDCAKITRESCPGQ